MLIMKKYNSCINATWRIYVVRSEYFRSSVLTRNFLYALNNPTEDHVDRHISKLIFDILKDIHRIRLK